MPENPAGNDGTLEELVAFFTIAANRMAEIATAYNDWLDESATALSAAIARGIDRGHDIINRQQNDEP